MKTSIFLKLISIILAITTVLSLTYISFASEYENRLIYVSPYGSDSGSGTESSPYATLEKAFSNLGSGGTVVIMGELTSDKTVLNANATSKCKNAVSITVTGKNPRNGVRYATATLPVNSPRLYCELKIDNAKLVPTRNYAFFNTYGNKLIFGENITNSDFPLYIHGGSYGNTVVNSSNIEINSGEFNTIYLGGAFASSSANGISGNSYFTINDGSVSNLVIGFDSSSAGQSEGTIEGNVIIRHNGGIINKISQKLLKDSCVNGYIAIITTEGLSAQLDLPKAKNGTYIINTNKNGTIRETNTPGLFEITPDKDYTAYINGKSVITPTATIPEGECYVKFLKDTLYCDYEGALLDGTGNMFYPDMLTTREEFIISVARAAFSDYNATYEEGFALLEEYHAVPHGWTFTDSTLPVTRAEAIYILSCIFDVQTDGKKLFEYSDVTEEHIYYDAIKKLSASGKLVGRAKDKLFPDEELTRVQLSVLLSAFFSRKAKDNTKSPFTDITSELLPHVICVTTDRNEGKWDFTENKFILPENGNTERYVKALYEQSSVLSPSEIKNASDTIALAVRKNILSTPNTADIYDFGLLGIETIYYVSEKNGSDYNDGLSPQSAYKTLDMIHGKINKKKNVAVLLERGGVYRTGSGTSPFNLAGSKNIVIGSYGTGAKPIVMQSRMNYANARWDEVLPNVYRLIMPLRNVGVMAFDHDIWDYSDNTFEETYGEIENIDTQGFGGIEDLNKDLQFYCELQPLTFDETTTTTENGVTITTTTVTETYDRFSEGYLYLYSEHGNPAERFSSIEIGENYDLVDGAAHGAIIDNISFKFTGSHAIGLSTSENLTVENCIFSWLGGSILWETENITTTVTKSDGSAPTVTKKLVEATGYGNAVEIYGGCDGFYVRDNWIYQIFDDGITNQYHQPEIDCIQRDMRYTGNLLEYVYHDFSNCNFSERLYYEKEFPTEGDGAYTDYTADLIVAYNICRMAGYGWGGPMKNRVHQGQMYRSAGIGANKDELVAYNIFDSSGGYLIFTSPNANEVYDKNIYIQTAGTRLIGRMQVGNFPYTENAYKDIVYHVNDTDAVAVIFDADTIKDCRPAKRANFDYLGAEVRNDGKKGLRFIFEINKDEIEALDCPYPTSYTDNKTGFGVVVMPKEYVTGTLNKNTAYFDGETLKRAKVVPAVNIYGQSDSNITFTICITDISSKNENRIYCAVPYITYEKDGATVTHYGDIQEASIISCS